MVNGDNAELEETIKNMSPEELAAFQKQNCIFCQIISGNVPSRVVYKDDHVTALLDINPAAEGHLLVLPNEHYAVMPQIPEELLNHLSLIVKGLSHTCIKALGVEGTSIFAANGAAAGQRASHFMFHIIPRKEKDGVPLQLKQHEITKEQLETLRKQLTTLFGKKEAKNHNAAEESKEHPDKQHKKPATVAGAAKTSSAKAAPGAKGKSRNGSTPDPSTKKPDLDAIAELLK